MRVLVVDDQPINILLAREILGNELEIYAATSGAEALERCLAAPPDLILLDLIMPEMDGIETCRRLHEADVTRDIPVIFVTGGASAGDEDACWAAGAVDFVSKPVNPTTLRNRVRLHLTLKNQADQLRRLAFFDPLTGLPNRRQFDDRFFHECRKALRGGTALSVIMIDVDFFKLYNDRYGHPAGDECLVSVARAIASNAARPSDLAARYGGEEFICILPETDLPGGVRVANEILESIRRLDIRHADSPTGVVSASLGVACFSHGQLSDRQLASSLLRVADTALYRAKQEGRARTIGLPVKDLSNDEVTSNNI